MIQAPDITGMSVRVRGLVQGVGFRPTVWRVARDCGLAGDVLNDGAGVLIRAWGASRMLDRFLVRLEREAPPLARIDRIERMPLTVPPSSATFEIRASALGAARTGVVPDAAICAACAREIETHGERRYGYAFANCTNCGPRFSIIRSIPYDRARTSMREFAVCADCAREYANAGDRRFHAQPIACPVCGPHLWLEDSDGEPVGIHANEPPRAGAVRRDLDVIGEVLRRLSAGAIVAIKGAGGFQLACDATEPQAVLRLRERKHRDQKAFALMARDFSVIERYCAVDVLERKLLSSSAAPIVLLKRQGAVLPESIAPGIRTLGFMLPCTPLHHLLMASLDRPLVMTSGNFAGRPPCTDNDTARTHLGAIADAFLMHDRDIVNRVDDSVARVIDRAPRILRRARGYAPASIRMPAGFEDAPPIVAMGGELKNTFCMLEDGEVVLSAHQGDLSDATTHEEFRSNLDSLSRLFDHVPAAIAVDDHPEYLATKVGIARAQGAGLRLERIQHHHAHVVSCLVDNSVPREASAVLGIVMDGLGMGSRGELWGGEFLQAGYEGFDRLARLKPVALLGGEQAMREPWRNAYAHLQAAIGWRELVASYGQLEIVRFLRTKPLAVFEKMLDTQLQCPPASSCGRLFDAVAAATGVCREQVTFEGQAAMMLEAAVDSHELLSGAGYSFSSDQGTPLRGLDPTPMWRSLLDDLRSGIGIGVIAARFHRGLADAITEMAIGLARERGIGSVALSGGVFQNVTLFERTTRILRDAGLEVLTHRHIPPNDGGLSVGQVAIAAARALAVAR